MKNISFCKVYKSDVEDVVEVDLSNCKNDKDIFDVFKVVFQFPDWFDENWNAFHDSMTNLCFDVKDVLVVKVYGFQNIFELLKESANYILEDLIILSKGEATQDNGNNFNAIIYLFDVDTNCEKFVLKKDISGLEFVSNDKKNICPVCGYEGLEEPVYDKTGEPSFEICSCCGFEFGFDDYSEHKTFEQYRNEWIKNSAKWEIKEDKPKNWELDIQLNNIKSKQRLFEEKVIDFFVSQIPEINNYVKDAFKYCDLTEEAGMYIVLPDIVRYLTSCVNKKEYARTEKFFDVYNEFYEKFAEEYHQVVNTDTMYNLNAVELFEIIEEYEEDDKKKIIPLMSEKLQNDYRKIH